MIVIPALLLLGSLLPCDYAMVQSDTIDSLRTAAMSTDVKLNCTWDCNCTFKQARSCCCAADEMFQLEENTLKKIYKLWESIDNLTGSVRQLTANSKVAFKATMKSPGTPCLGPKNTDVILTYPTVSLNDGNGYKPVLGVFIAPHAGVYVISYTVYSQVSINDPLYHNVVLMKNGVALAGLWEDNREDRQDSGTQLVVVELQDGDQVYVMLTSGRKLCGELHYNIFSGYMVYPFVSL